MELTNDQRDRFYISLPLGARDEVTGCHFGRRQDPFKPDRGVCPSVSGGVCQGW